MAAERYVIFNGKRYTQILDSIGTLTYPRDGNTDPSAGGVVIDKKSNTNQIIQPSTQSVSTSKQPTSTPPTLDGSTQAENVKNPYLNENGALRLTPDQVVAETKRLSDQKTEILRTPQDDPTFRSEDLKKIDIQIQQLQEAIAKSSKCLKRESSAGSWIIKGTPDCQQFNNSVLYKSAVQLFETELNLPDPCGKGTLNKINTFLHNFFTTLKGMKQYGDLFLKTSINTISDVTNLIRKTASLISGVLKILVQRIRNFLLNKIRQLISSVIDLILTNLAKVLKDVLIQEIVQAILCKFDDIIKGLSNLVSDFLFALVGKVINTGFCAVEQFTNALVNNLAATIDNQIAPVLDKINDVLGGVGQIAGSVFQAIDFILGFESFLCASPNCPDVIKWKASPWGGPSKTAIDNFSNFKIPTGTGIIQNVDDSISGFSIFGSKIGNNQNEIPSEITQCDVGAFRCGPPIVEFFGGGGSGAVGNAVVNSIGQVVGVSLFNKGTGYTTPPYVIFKDNCGNGNYASGYTQINNEGEIEKVVMINYGDGYLDKPNGLDEFGVQEPQVLEETKIKTYVSCIDEFKIISTGIGYSPNDTVTITPDSPGLEVKISMTEEGQIIKMDIISPSCGLTEVPKVTINSATGDGVEIKPILKFYTLDEYNEIRDNNYKSQELVQVIDCVYPR